jgi:hypothetical protein
MILCNVLGRYVDLIAIKESLDEEALDGENAKNSFAHNDSGRYCFDRL